MNWEAILEAARDMRYLLNRGYRREKCVEFVGDKYRLKKTERMVLYRCVYGSEEARTHREKLISPEDVKGKRLAIDGYNVLITVESALKGATLIECDDGFVRDVSAIHGKYKMTSLTGKSLSLIMNYLERLSPSEISFFFDQQVSKSGELSALVRQLMSKRNLKGTACTSRQADTSALRWGDVIATSDSAIIQRAEKVFDLAGFIVRKEFPARLVKLA